MGLALVRCCGFFARRPLPAMAIAASSHILPPLHPRLDWRIPLTPPSRTLVMLHAMRRTMMICVALLATAALAHAYDAHQKVSAARSDDTRRGQRMGDGSAHRTSIMGAPRWMLSPARTAACSQSPLCQCAHRCCAALLAVSCCCRCLCWSTT